MKSLIVATCWVGLFAICNVARAVVLIGFDPNGNAGNETTIVSTTTAAGLNSSTLSRGSGLTASPLANAFSSTSFTLSDTRTAGDFLQFTVSPMAGFQLSLDALNANFRRSTTGPDRFQWQFSLDAFATAGIDLGSEITFTSTTTNGVAQAAISLSGISALQNTSTAMTFRLFGYSASDVDGTFALGRLSGNDLAIDGSVSAVPEPTTSLFAGALFGVALLGGRRRAARH